MAFDGFLKFSGIAAAESQDDKFKGSEGWIDVLSFTYGVTQKGAAGTGGGQAAGKADLQDFTFTQKYHKGSPELFVKCCTGEHMKTAQFVCRKAGGVQLNFLTLDFKEVLVTSVNTQGGAGADEIPVETVSITFSEVKFLYKEQNSETGGEKSQATGGFNQKLNKKL